MGRARTLPSRINRWETPAFQRLGRFLWCWRWSCRLLLTIPDPGFLPTERSAHSTHFSQRRRLKIPHSRLEGDFIPSAGLGKAQSHSQSSPGPLAAAKKIQFFFFFFLTAFPSSFSKVLILGAGQWLEFLVPVIPREFPALLAPKIPCFYAVLCAMLGRIKLCFLQSQVIPVWNYSLFIPFFPCNSSCIPGSRRARSFILKIP